VSTCRIWSVRILVRPAAPHNQHCSYCQEFCAYSAIGKRVYAGKRNINWASLADCPLFTFPALHTYVLKLACTSTRDIKKLKMTWLGFKEENLLKQNQTKMILIFAKRNRVLIQILRLILTSFSLYWCSLPFNYYIQERFLTFFPCFSN